MSGKKELKVVPKNDLAALEDAEKKRAEEAAEKAKAEADAVSKRKMILAEAQQANDYMASLLGSVVLVREQDGQKTGLCDGDRMKIARSHKSIKDALALVSGVGNEDGDGK